jgi:hypothetical protein
MAKFFKDLSITNIKFKDFLIHFAFLYNLLIFKNFFFNNLNLTAKLNLVNNYYHMKSNLGYIKQIEIIVVFVCKCNHFGGSTQNENMGPHIVEIVGSNVINTQD